MIKAVMFDIVGVMTDSEHPINKAALAGLREYCIEPEPSDFLPFAGMGEDHYIDGVVRKYGLTYVPQMKARVYEIYFLVNS
jgi:beta-phosphoglucomutase-like phosphatase (HAD superfamily)